MKVIIEKHLLDQVLEICKILESAEHVKESNWLDNVPEKHRKFSAYWDELGRPQLETKIIHFSGWRNMGINELFDNDRDYRIKDDPHWELRLKWVNSNKTLPIEYKDTDNTWKPAKPSWFKDQQYREAKPWYEQEISGERPILLCYQGSLTESWTTLPNDYDDYKPLTDAEIDALKRGF